MFSDNATINELTALLLAHGVRHAVTCPGSRNAPICHNMNEAGMACHPVTDERSAAFFAIGLSQSTGEAVALCVTSGSAILDTSAGVAEAYYQGVPLIVIAADRPRAWIGQLDGQTMPQGGALGAVARRAVDLPEGETAEDLWHANRLINEALMTATGPARGPVLINVPLREPLYNFNTPKLPEPRVCKRMRDNGADVVDQVAEAMLEARRPLIVIGQTDQAQEARLLAERWATLYEPLASDGGEALNEAMHILRNSRRLRQEEYRPDKILYVGGHIVSKELKQFLRTVKGAETILVSEDGELHDVFQNTTLVGSCDLHLLFEKLTKKTDKRDEAEKFTENWKTLLETAKTLCRNRAGVHSQLQTVQTIIEKADGMTLHFANSSAVRLGCMASRKRFYCNRGINGIDGSVSTAAGHSVGRRDRLHLCVTGDLSFFYDSNALWNAELRDNLRVVVMNNGGGGIFCRFEGLRGSEARERIVMASHAATAKGICLQNDVEYAEAQTPGEVEKGMEWLTVRATGSGRPRLLEIFTDSETDQRALNDYYEQIVSEYDTRMEKD